MKTKRFIFLTCLTLCGLLALNNARWEGHLTHSYQSWIIDLERSPAWRPPPKPGFEIFHEHFKKSLSSLHANPTSARIDRVLKLDTMALEFFLYAWPVLIIFGLMNISKKGDVRDVVLHLGFCAAIGLSMGALLCILLWLVFGGWGPPIPMLFGLVGIYGGIVYGYRDYTQHIHVKR